MMELRTLLQNVAHRKKANADEDLRDDRAVTTTSVLLTRTSVREAMIRYLRFMYEKVYCENECRTRYRIRETEVLVCLAMFRTMVPDFRLAATCLSQGSSDLAILAVGQRIACDALCATMDQSETREHRFRHNIARSMTSLCDALPDDGDARIVRNLWSSIAIAQASPAADGFAYPEHARIVHSMIRDFFSEALDLSDMYERDRLGLTLERALCRSTGHPEAWACRRRSIAWTTLFVHIFSDFSAAS